MMKKVYRKDNGLGLVDVDTPRYGVNADGRDVGQVNNKGFPKTIYAHFESEEDVAEFSKLIGVRIIKRTKVIWFK